MPVRSRRDTVSRLTDIETRTFDKNTQTDTRHRSSLEPLTGLGFAANTTGKTKPSRGFEV